MLKGPYFFIWYSESECNCTEVEWSTFFCDMMIFYTVIASVFTTLSWMKHKHISPYSPSHWLLYVMLWCSRLQFHMHIISLSTFTWKARKELLFKCKHAVYISISLHIWNSSQFCAAFEDVLYKEKDKNWALMTGFLTALNTSSYKSSKPW